MSSTNVELGERLPIGDTRFTFRYVAPESFEDDDSATVIEILGRAFNGGPSWFEYGEAPAEHLHWKAALRPGESVIELTEDGQRIVGFLLKSCHRYLLRGHEVLVDVGTDATLDPDYQGLGLSAARREAREGVSPLTSAALSVNFGMHPLSHSRRARQQDRRRTANQIQGLARLVTPRSLTGRGRRGSFDSSEGASQTRAVIERQRRGRLDRATLARLFFGARMALAALRPSRAAVRHPGWLIETADHFDDDANEFWREAATQFDLIQLRDRDFLNWRFCDPRGGPFIVRTAREEGRLLGYVALRVDSRETVIADLLALPGRQDVAQALVEDALSIARGARSATVRAWMFERHPYRRLMRRQGFVAYRLPATFSIRPETADWSELDFLTAPEARLHYMTGDTDHV